MTTPAGWYPDTEVPGGLRYWDGSVWTEHRTPPAAPATPEPAAEVPPSEQPTSIVRLPEQPTTVVPTQPAPEPTPEPAAEEATGGAHRAGESAPAVTPAEPAATPDEPAFPAGWETPPMPSWDAPSSSPTQVVPVTPPPATPPAAPSYQPPAAPSYQPPAAPLYETPAAPPYGTPSYEAPATPSYGSFDAPQAPPSYDPASFTSPPPPGPPGPPGAPSGGGGSNKALFAILGGVAALVVIAALVLTYFFVIKDDDSTTTASTSTSASKTKTKTSSTKTSESESSGQPTTPPADGEVTDGDFTFSVSKTDTGDTVTSVEGAEATADGMYYVVYLNVTNNGTSPVTFLSTMQRLNAAGKSYSPDDEANFYLNGDAVFEIQPGETVETGVAFDVPVDTEADSIEAHGDLLSQGVELPLS